MRGWTLEDYKNEARQYPSKLKLRLSAPAVYNALRKFPGELETLFPPIVAPIRVINEASVREAAMKYRSRGEFADHDMRMHSAAVSLGIMESLGFPPLQGAYSQSTKMSLYMADIILVTGEPGVVFGITTRHPSARYPVSEAGLMSNKVFYRFEAGKGAADAEKHLRCVFSEAAIKSGESPLRDKSGTTGEILSGVPLSTLLSELSRHCGPSLPPCEIW